MKRLTITVSDDLATAIDRERRRQDTSAAAVVRTALETHLVVKRQNAIVGIFDLGETGSGESIGERAEEILDADWADWIWNDSGLGDHDSPYRDRLQADKERS